MPAKVTIKEGPGGGLAGLSEFLAKANSWEPTLQFNPSDSASVEAAIVEMQKQVDALAARYAKNPAVQVVIQEIKTGYENAIREQQRDNKAEGE